MTTAKPSRAFRCLCGCLLIVTLACGVGQRYYSGSVAIPANALNVIVDELVELHRQALVGAGDRTAMFRAWHDLRSQFVIRTVNGRTRGGPMLVRVRIATAENFASRPAPCHYYVLTPREDDAWELAPLTSRLSYWLR